MRDPVASLLVAVSRLSPDVEPGLARVDWDRVIEAAEHHAVAPLLTRRLAALPEGAPPYVLARLSARFDANALRNVALSQELAELLGRLALHGVSAMPIKGPTLALCAYGDLALREFGDLDIVVRPSDLDHARALLDGWGYQPLARLSPTGERALRASDHHVPLVHERSKLMVELHWSLDNGRPGRYLDADWVWKNARTVSLLGRDVPSLSWSALLVYLCVHGAKHGFSRLGWLRDIAGVLAAAPEGELAAAAELASEVDARRRLALGVRLAREFLGAPARRDVEPVELPDWDALERDVHALLFGAGGTGLASWIAFQCATFDKLRDRAGYWFHTLAAPHVADVEALTLPRWLAGAYYVFRPARLAAREARALFGVRPAR